MALADMWRVFDTDAAQPEVASEGRTGCVGYAGETGGLPIPLRTVLATLPPYAEA